MSLPEQIEKTKFGWAQRNNPPPPFIARLLAAAIFLFSGIGTYIVVIPSWALCDHTKVWMGYGASFVLLVLQVASILFGIEVKEDNSNTHIDDK